MKNLHFKICSFILSCICALLLHTQEKDSITNALKLQIKYTDSDTLKINLKLDL